MTLSIRLLVFGHLLELDFGKPEEQLQEVPEDDHEHPVGQYL
ncbi:hypothetical protein [Micromonospora sp. NPDC049240]